MTAPLPRWLAVTCSLALGNGVGFGLMAGAAAQAPLAAPPEGVLLYLSVQAAGFDEEAHPGVVDHIGRLLRDEFARMEGIELAGPDAGRGVRSSCTLSVSVSDVEWCYLVRARLMRAGPGTAPPPSPGSAEAVEDRTWQLPADLLEPALITMASYAGERCLRAVQAVPE